MRHLVSVLCLRGNSLSKRPHGFIKFITRNGFYGIFLVGSQSRLSFHKSQDPQKEFNSAARSRPVPVDYLQAWWVAGKPIANRIEHAFKERFQFRRDDDGLFNTDQDEAAGFIEKTVKDMRTWAASENDMINLMDCFARRKGNIPPHAPSPLPGITELPPLDSPSVLKHFEDGFMQHAA